MNFCDNSIDNYRRLANTLENHYQGLHNYLFHRITNARAEGYNATIQAVVASARGFRSFPAFRTAVLFRLGKLNMNPIPQ
jgi:transposase